MKTGFFALLALLLLVGCSLPTATPLPPTATAIPATQTPQPSPTSMSSPFLIVQSNSFVLGGVREGQWLSPQEASQGALDLSTYIFYDLQQPQAEARGKAPLARKAAPCFGSYTIELDIQPDSFSWVGVSAPWQAAPRPVETVPALTPPQSAALEALLAQNGTTQAVYQQINAYQVDLEGDGSLETILTATALEEESLHMVAPEEYSLAAILRPQSDGSVAAGLLIADFYTSEELTFPSAYAISAILDLNGDGKMEIVVHGRHWEGNLLIVYEIDGSEARRVLDTCCDEDATDTRCIP